MSNPATNKEPQPKGKGNDVTELVKQDLEARAQSGQKKYGERLTSDNGRKALVDAYQEALDLALYLKQELDERENERVNPNNTQVYAMDSFDEDRKDYEPGWKHKSVFLKRDNKTIYIHPEEIEKIVKTLKLDRAE